MEIVLGILGVLLALFVGFVVLLGLGARKVVKSVGERGSSFKPPAYQHVSVESGATSADICKIVEPYKRASGVGTRTQRLISQLENAQRKYDHLQNVASGSYARSDLSIDAVTEVIASAEESFGKLLRNSALLANGIQTFDAGNYHALKRQRGISTVRPSAAQDPMQARRLNEMEERLAALDEGLQRNESWLLEFDRWAANLSWLQTATMQQDLHPDEATTGTTAAASARVPDEPPATGRRQTPASPRTL